MSLKFFTFEVENGRTKERARFIGQGSTMVEAWNDAMKGITSAFRPNSNGNTAAGRNTVLPLSVTLADGRRVTRPQREFEGDIKFGEVAEVKIEDAVEIEFA